MIGIVMPMLRESKVMCKRIGAINCNVKTLESYLRQHQARQHHPQQIGKMLITILEKIKFKLFFYVFINYFNVIILKINFKILKILF
jgi:hypothetical protein